jgi:hypothetical protein
MAHAAETLARIMAENGKPNVFDFSEASVAALDATIQSDWAPGTKPSDQTVGLMGAYLGEVLVRNLGGTWVRSGNNPEPGIQLSGGDVAFPLTKVRKRVQLGQEHDLAYFYQELSAYVQEGPARQSRWTRWKRSS